MPSIIGWTINVTWSNGVEENLSDMDGETASAVDAWLTEVEEERNGDTPSEDDEEEPICCVGCGKDGKFPENRDGDTMCECCMSDDDEERKCCMCYIDVRDITFWGCDYCGLNVCETCAINDDGIIHCGNFDCK